MSAPRRITDHSSNESGLDESGYTVEDLRCLGAIVCLLIGCAVPAAAQNKVYLGGVVFADVQRSSGETASIVSTGLTKLDGTVVGGGVRGGAYLAPRWSVELSLDLGAPLDRTVTPQIVPLGTTRGGIVPTIPTIFPFPQFEERISSRTTATSVVLAYHPPARKRFRAGVGGGLSFMHTAVTIVETFPFILLGSGAIVSPIPTPTTTRFETVSNQMAATVTGELAFELFKRADIVPEIRAHGFDNRFVIRPGVGVRWRW